MFDVRSCPREGPDVAGGVPDRSGAQSATLPGRYAERPPYDPAISNFAPEDGTEFRRNHPKRHADDPRQPTQPRQSRRSPPPPRA